MLLIKKVKFELFYIIIFFSNSLAFGASISSNSKNFDLVPIYEKGRSWISQDVIIYKSPQLSGKKVGTINKDSITFDGNKIFFKDFDKCLDLQNCKVEKNLEFIVFDQQVVYLKIDSYVKDVAIASVNSYKVFFRIGFHNFAFRTRGNGALWREYNVSTKADKLNELIDYPVLSSFLLTIKKCILSKSVECLKENYDKTNEDNSTYLNEQILARAMLEDNKLCAEFEKDQLSKDWLGVFPENIIRKANIKNDVFWNELKKAIELNVAYSLIQVTKKDFDSVVVIRIDNHLAEKMKCNNYKNLTLKLVNTNGVWKIKNIESYAFKI